MNSAATAAATFTEFDQTQGQSYVDNRSLLMQIWDLATTYPCLACKIEVRIRKADPRNDYAYEDSMSDAAIVVELRWMNASKMCDFLQCHSTYPSHGRGVTCGARDEPRVYPSGDETVVTACEPMCYFLRNLKNAESIDDLRRNYYGSDAHYVMSVRDGLYRRGETLASETKDNDTERATASDVTTVEYVPETDTCEIGNLGLVTYVSQPWSRANDGDGNLCRVTNFTLGEDLKYAARVGAIGTTSAPLQPSTATGRYSSSYCAAFDKEFDAATRTCVVPSWEQTLSYTFLGGAMIRLARNAINGGDRCDEMFPALPTRPETDPSVLTNSKVLSRNAWYNDVDRSWCCPPPNILLSDLGVADSDQVWTNRNGGTVERTRPSDYARSRRDKRATSTVPTVGSSYSLADVDSRAVSRYLLQKRYVGGTKSGAESAYVGAVKSSSSRVRRSTNEKKSVLDFDEIYATIEEPRRSDAVREQILELTKDLGIVVSDLALEALIARLMKSAYNRALRYVGQRFTGEISRTLLGLGLRVTTARMLSTVMTGLSTRLMLAMGATASGIGTIVGIVELISFLLDMALLAGWDPGHYKAESSNDAFDELALAWLRAKTRQRVPRVDPYYLLFLYSSTYERTESAVVEGETDDSKSATVESNERFGIKSRRDVPWFFAKFDKAVEAIVNDAAESGDDAIDAREATNERVPKIRFAAAESHDSFGRTNKRKRAAATVETDVTRTRPIVSDSPVVCSMLWTIHYFAHRRVNSSGQRVDASSNSVELSDDTVSEAIRDNELAAFLQSSVSPTVPRSRVAGVARRNVIAKSLRLFDRGLLLFGSMATVALVAGSTIILNTASIAALVIITLSVVLVLAPLTILPTIVELVAPDGSFGRTYDRRDDVADRDDIDRVCDAVTTALSTESESPFVELLRDFFSRDMREELRVLRR